MTSREKAMFIVNSVLNDTVEDADGRRYRFQRVGYMKDGKVEMFIGTHDRIPGGRDAD